MKVRYTMVNQASGSIGGLTAANGRSGPYWRKRVKPLNPQSDLQYSVRGAFAASTTAWRELTESQRLGWGAYADSIEETNPVGEPKRLTGAQAFVGSDSFGLRLGLSPLTNPPGTTGRASFTPPTEVEYGIGSEELTITGNTGSWRGAAGGVLAVFVGRGVSLGVNSYKGPWKLWTHVVRGASPPAQPLVLTPGESPWGAFAADTKYWVRLASRAADGRLSADWVGQLTIVP